MLLTSTGVMSRSQQEESALLLRKIEELNKNTARLIVEAGKLIQESKQLSAQVKSLRNPSTKLKKVGSPGSLCGEIEIKRVGQPADSGRPQFRRILS
jgi:hypothetical protein